MTKERAFVNQRDACLGCNRVRELCLCATIQRFEIEPLIVLLVHPREVKRTIGTFRIVKLALTNSISIRGLGEDFDSHPKVLSLVHDPALYPMILFPGESSLNLSTASTETLSERIPTGRRLVIFVLDGTWSTAKQMIKKSAVIRSLPQLSFDVTSPSAYEFRKQPEEFCLSTVEAVSVLIENLREKGLCTPTVPKAHHEMVRSFKELVASQTKYWPQSGGSSKS